MWFVQHEKTRHVWREALSHGHDLGKHVLGLTGSDRLALPIRLPLCLNVVYTALCHQIAGLLALASVQRTSPRQCRSGSGSVGVISTRSWTVRNVEVVEILRSRDPPSCHILSTNVFAY